MTADRILRRQSNVTLIILRYLQTQNMGCPLSNLFDMWIFGSRYVDTWFLDIWMHFSHQERLEEIHISLLVLESLMLVTYIHDDMTALYWDSNHIQYYVIHRLVRGVVSLSCYDHWFEILLVYQHDKRHKDADLHLSDRIPALNMPDIQRPGTLNPKTNAVCRHCKLNVIQRLSLASCSGGEWIKMTRWLLTINGTVSIEKKKRQFGQFEYLNVAEDYLKHFAGIAKYLVLFVFCKHR